MNKISVFIRPVLPLWVCTWCGLTGAALCLAGIICFFAANWQVLGICLKFGLPLAGLLFCAFGAYYKGLASGVGQIFCVACGLFIGIFWAVYGQIYSTGAFNYEFCRAWLLCLLPLALLAANRWLWLLWAVVCNVYLYAWCDFSQANNLRFWLFVGFNGVCFTIAEWMFYKTHRADGYSLFFLIPLIFALLVRGIGEWNSWFWGCSCALLLLGVYAYAQKRGTAQLGLCVLAFDCLWTVCILISHSRLGGPLVSLLAVVLLFSVSMWGVYMLLRRGNKHV